MLSEVGFVFVFDFVQPFPLLVAGIAPCGLPFGLGGFVAAHASCFFTLLRFGLIRFPFALRPKRSNQGRTILMLQMVLAAIFSILAVRYPLSRVARQQAASPQLRHQGVMKFFLKIFSLFVNVSFPFQVDIYVKR